MSNHLTATRAITKHTPSSSRDAVGAYLASITAASRRPMLESLRSIAQILRGSLLLGNKADQIERVLWHKIDYPTFQGIVGKLRDGPLAPATANRHIAALRGVLRQCFLLGLLSADTWMRIKETKKIKGSRKPRGRALTEDDVAALLAACETDTPRGARDVAMLALLYGCGLRRDEAAHAITENYDATRGSLTIIGKGNKERIVFMAGPVKTAVDRWLFIRERFTVPTILMSTNAQGDIGKTSEQISGSALLHACNRLAKRAGMKPFGCHDLRRAFATHHLDRGVDIFMVQRMMGHASSETTGQYDMRTDKQQMRIAGTVPFPVGVEQ